ncbi:MAG: hypothetical protein RLZZ283_677 [Candidatus Parcubacteria bacterium]|jgi:hypothetical protein
MRTADMSGHTETLEGGIDQLQKEEKVGIQNHINSIDAKRALTKPTRCSCCDGRIDSTKANREGAIRLPGSVVLLPESEWPAQAKRFRALGITTIDSHEDCGAAGMAYEKQFGKKGSPAQIDAYAEERVRHFCKTQGFHFGKHITKHDMASEHHNELVLYYDASPAGMKKFEQSALRGQLSQGFALTESGSDNPHAHLLALIGIAFSKHGSAEAALKRGVKFKVRVVAPTSALLVSKRHELTEVIKNSEYADKVDVDGFVINGWR